jgi:hypothetical protein
VKRRFFDRVWVPETAWFIAALGAIPVGIFLDRENWLGAAVASAATLLLAVLAAWLRSVTARQPNRAQPLSDVTGLLRYVWEYPRGKSAQRSWAAKESAILRDELAVARERPGLGVAIITTELAQFAFGEAANSRLEAMVSWTFQQCEKEPPFRVTAEFQNPIDFEVLAVTPDLRHTMAFAVILLRLNREHIRSAGYVELALSAQETDGGWPAASPTTESAVFATLYGTELVALAIRNPALPSQARRQLPNARRDGVAWLLRNRSSRGLWSTGVFRDRAWDCAVATAWVLHRMLPVPRALQDEWQSCVRLAVSELVRLCEESATWIGVSDELRFRIEARVAAALRRTLTSQLLTDSGPGTARRFLGAWSLRAEELLGEFDERQIDVGTAAFAVWAMAEPAEIERLGRSISRVGLPVS